MNKILFIDTLATGLNPEKCAIYRLGGIFCEENASGIVEKQRFDICVRPFETARIMENSLWTGGVTRSMLIYFPEQSDAFNDFFRLINENINLRNAKDKLYIAGFNVSSFDIPFIKNWFARNSNQRFRDCFYVQTLDIMSLAAFALINDRDNMPDFHLGTAARFLGVNPENGGYNSCLDNAQTCLEMYKVLKTRLNVGDNSTYEKTDKFFCNHSIK